MTRNAAECPFSTQCSVFHINSFRFFFFPSSKESKSQRKRIEPERKKKRKKSETKEMMRFEMRALQSGPAHPSTSKKNKKTKEKHEDSSRKTGLRKWACSVHYVTNEFRSGWREGGGWGEEESNHRPSLATDGPIRGDDDLLLFFFFVPERQQQSPTGTRRFGWVFFFVFLFGSRWRRFHRQAVGSD